MDLILGHSLAWVKVFAQFCKFVKWFHFHCSNPLGYVYDLVQYCHEQLKKSKQNKKAKKPNQTKTKQKDPNPNHNKEPANPQEKENHYGKMPSWRASQSFGRQLKNDKLYKNWLQCLE